MQLVAALSVILAGGSVVDLDGTIFVQIVVFFLAFFVLRALVFKPVLDLFIRREEGIEGARQKARELQKEADEADRTFNEEIRKVRQAANEERDRLRAEGQQVARELLDRSRGESERMLGEARRKMDEDGRKVREEIQGQVPVLARQIASRLLGREVS